MQKSIFVFVAGLVASFFLSSELVKAEDNAALGSERGESWSPSDIRVMTRERLERIFAKPWEDAEVDPSRITYDEMRAQQREERLARCWLPLVCHAVRAINRALALNGVTTMTPKQTISRMTMSPQEINEQKMRPIMAAVAYVLATIGVVILIALGGRRLLSARTKSRGVEEKMDR